MTTSVFYVYEHWRLDRDECFYVGKGKGIRAYKMRDRNAHHRAIMGKLSREGSGMEVRMVATGLTEDEAFALERERIAFWRKAGVDLVNRTSGGQGTSGMRHSDETKAKLSAYFTENPVLSFAGRRHTAEVKKKLSDIGKVRGAPKLTDVQQKAASDWHRGRKRSAETCAKISEKAKGRPSKLKGVPSQLKGTVKSDGFKENLSRLKKEWWANKKAEALK